MKYSIISFAFFLSVFNSSAQNLNYAVHGTYANAVKKEKITDAKTMSDIIPYYPASWIMKYNSAEIVVTTGGKTLKAEAKDYQLDSAQTNLLNTATLGSDISINIDYEYKNAVTDNTETGTMNYSTTVIPEIEADYIGGHEALMEYIKKNGIDKIPEKDPKHAIEASIRFTVNEVGEISNAKISRASDDPKTDNLLLDIINKMPKWRPAENSKGIRVKQEFVFNVSNRGGC
ncbi:MAG TPA: energy transducer TonB [Saprospiraceae bacterium]|nr:energy transducer TonB [Saprospiraceae bacterium]